MKKLLVLLLVLSLVAVLAACAGDDPGPATPTPTPGEAAPGQAAPGEAAAPGATEAPQPPPQGDELPMFGLMIFDFANTHNSYIRQGVLNYAASAGPGGTRVANVVVTDGQNDQARQMDQLATLLARGDLDIILMGMVDPGAAQTALDMVAAEDLPMFFFNRAPDFDVLQTYDRVWYTGIPWRLPGYIQAEEILRDWVGGYADAMDRSGDGILQYVIVQGNLEQPDAIHRTAANQDRLAEFERDGLIQVELLAIDLGHFNTTRSRELMETWIMRFGDEMEVVLTNSDAMAIGAIEALRADGFFTPGRNMFVYSINALPDAMPLLLAGELRSTVLTDPWAQARALVDMSLNVLSGNPIYLADPTTGTEWTMCPINKDIRMNDEIPIRIDNIQIAVEAFENCL